MAIPKQLIVINDFSSGEVDVEMKRGADSVTATGGRQMSNWRVLNSRKKANRPGRSALFLESGRVEEVLISPGNKFFLAFGSGYLRVYNASGAQVFATTVKGDGVTPIPWSAQSAQKLTYAIASWSLSVYIAYADGFPNNVPQVLTWDGVSQTSTWTLATFAPTIEASGQKRTLFYRLSPQNITMQPSATTGNINITFSANVLEAGMVGAYMTFCDREILITGVSSGTSGTATVIEPLPPAQQLAVTSQSGTFNIGDLLIGANSGANGIVTSNASQQQILFGGPPNFAVGQTLTGETSGATGIVLSASPYDDLCTVSLLTGTAFVANEEISNGTTSKISASVSKTDLIVQVVPSTDEGTTIFIANEDVAGPSGTATISTVTTEAPQAVSVWDDEVMNSYRGYPTSVFYDQGRLGFCNFGAIPNAIAWSAIELPTDFYLDASSADNAIMEQAPGKSQVLYVQPGMESSEFVFCDNAVYYIPISQTYPLEPGSVSFNLLSEEGCYPVQPQPAEQTILYMKAGGLQVGAVQAPGAYYRPFIVDVVAEFHTHLFTASAPVAIAIPAASVQFQELYAYILLANGSLVIGRYAMREGLLDVGPEGKPKIGWLPWTGVGNVSWISACEADVIFTSAYNGISVVEKLDDTQYLDAAVSVNNLPAPMAPPDGKGPLFNFPGPNSAVFLIDLGTRFMGTYQVDGNGFIVPQNQGGENLNSAQLIAGQPWTAVFEPFIPDAGMGEDQRQRTRRRKIVRAAISVENSTGFVYAATRVPAYFVGDNAEVAAPLRENTYRFRYPGRFFDPRVVLEKDTPGPLTVLEHAIEVTI